MQQVHEGRTKAILYLVHDYVIIDHKYQSCGEMIKKFCSVSVKSTRLLTCLSISTMCLLILTTIVIITVISITPIIVLGIAEMGGGQRDVILLPSNSRINALNSTQIS